MSKKIVPDWKLERYLLGELPVDDITLIRTYESLDDGLRERVAALRASDAEILDRYPPEQAAKRIRNLCAVGVVAASAGDLALPWVSDVRSWWRNLGGVSRWAIPIAACVALFLALPMGVVDLERGVAGTGASPDADREMVMAMGNIDGDPTFLEDNRVKGVVSGDTAGVAVIEVWRKEGDDARRLEANAAARKGDVIQLRYMVPEQCYGTIVSVDGRGDTYVHLAGNHGKAASLAPGRSVALKNAYELDDAPHYEIFYLITATEEFSLDDITRSLKSATHPISDDEGSVLSPKQSVVAFKLRKLNELGMK